MKPSSKIYRFKWAVGFLLMVLLLPVYSLSSQTDKMRLGLKIQSRYDRYNWDPIEDYTRNRLPNNFSHSVSISCAKGLFLYYADIVSGIQSYQDQLYSDLRSRGQSWFKDYRTEFLGMNIGASFGLIHYGKLTMGIGIEWNSSKICSTTSKEYSTSNIYYFNYKEYDEYKKLKIRYMLSNYFFVTYDFHRIDISLKFGHSGVLRGFHSSREVYPIILKYNAASSLFSEFGLGFRLN